MQNHQDNNEIANKILSIKEKLGNQLIILTHHYQRKEVVELGDHRGDSFDLSQKAAADEHARFIVFCGVHFMAESAAILCQDHQTVQIPDISSGCPMADMATISNVEKAWEEVSGIVGSKSVMPLVYMNSNVFIKAHCGKNGGAVCTSSNAPNAFEWALGLRDKIFFFPDQHLGRNTGNRLNISPDEIIMWTPGPPLGGNSKESIIKAKVILWNGYCHVHTAFTVDHIIQMRNKFPDAMVVVHPECPREVVNAADAAGSTSFIVNYVDAAPVNSTVVIGTEINLVKRLAMENPDKTILALHDSSCSDMNKIDLESLLRTLENIGHYNVVTVPEEIKTDSRLALDRMLALAV